jgi:hypothetical protein
MPKLLRHGSFYDINLHDLERKNTSTCHHFMLQSAGSQLVEVLQVQTTEGKDLSILHSEHVTFKLQVSQNTLTK